MILFVASNNNHIKIFSPVAQKLFEAGKSIHFISLDSIYGQGASEALRLTSFGWSELCVDHSTRNWFELPWDDRIVLGKSSFAAVKQTFNTLKPEVVILANDTGTFEQFFTRVARCAGCKSVVLQDGIISLKAPPSIDHPVAIEIGDNSCDLLCLWGNGLNERLKKKNITTRTLVTGNPRYDSLSYPLTQKIQSQPVKVLVAGQAFGKYNYLSFQDEFEIYENILGRLCTRQNLQVFFKPHPQQNIIPYQQLQDNLHNNFEIIFERDSISCIQQIDVLVAVNSTMGIESILSGKPTILLPFLANKPHQEFINTPFECQNLEEFDQIFDDPDFPHNIQINPKIFKQFIQETVFSLDGKSAERVYAAIEDLKSIKHCNKNIDQQSNFWIIPNGCELNHAKFNEIFEVDPITKIDSTIIDNNNIPVSYEIPGIKYLHLPGKSILESVLYGLQNSSSAFVNFLLLGANLLPQYNEIIQKEFETNEDLLFLSSGYLSRDIFGNAEHVHRYDFPPEINNDNWTPPFAFTIRNTSDNAYAHLGDSCSNTTLKNFVLKLISENRAKIIPSALYIAPPFYLHSNWKNNTQSGHTNMWNLTKFIQSTHTVIDRSGTKYSIGDSPLTELECRILYELIKNFQPVQGLAIGLEYGIPALYILEAMHENGHGNLHAIDPNEKQNFNDIGLFNIERTGLDGIFQFFDLPSNLTLPSLLANQFETDFVFVEGSSLYDDIFVDWYYSDKMLHPGGVVVFNGWKSLPVVRAVTNFIEANLDYQAIEINPDINLRILVKRSSVNRAMNFIPFTNESEQ